MFYILSKLLTWMIMPTTLLVVTAILSFVVPSTRWRPVFRWLSFGLLVLFTNPLIVGLLYNWWEVDPVPYREIHGSYDLGIVLTGITDPYKEPKDRVHFNKGADRLIHAVELYHMGKVHQLLISGASGYLDDPDFKESHQLARMAREWGVPDSVIILEDRSNNTRQNALYSSEIIQNQYPDASLLLITSAFHMRRARACFTKVGLQPDPFPTDYYASEIVWKPDGLFIPNVGALVLWSKLIREWVGMLFYWIAGYL